MYCEVVGILLSVATLWTATHSPALRLGGGLDVTLVT
jgi:hypothetical protein